MRGGGRSPQNSLRPEQLIEWSRKLFLESDDSSLIGASLCLMKELTVWDLLAYALQAGLSDLKLQELDLIWACDLSSSLSESQAEAFGSTKSAVERFDWLRSFAGVGAS